MKIDWDVPIRMDDGLVLRADVFRPDVDGKYPAIFSYGPYGKGLAFQEGYKTAWEIMARDYPDAVAGSSNQYANWEVVDPERWVPDGYVCMRVDSRGAGRSPGYLCHNNARETRDIHLCMEWAAAQAGCSGKVGMNGISYYASNQWRAAASQPPPLAAIGVWEGWNDAYRESARHGGIICSFRKNWQDMQVKTVQHGQGERGAKSRVTGELVCGPEALSPDELEKNREDMWQAFLTRELWGPYYAERSPDLSKVTVPLLSAANWGGQGLHTRGNFEGFTGAASRQKWLEVNGGSHWAPFYTGYCGALLKLFVSSSTADADIFAVLRVFDPKGKEVSFYGALDPRTPVGQGWLRASQRKLDPERSLPHRPFHAHDQKQPLKAGEVVELDVEIWPTCIVIPAGYRIALTIRGRDYEHDGEAASLSNMKNPMRGCGPFIHDDPTDRPLAIFGGKVTLHFGPARQASVLLPGIPPK